jgi:hypothetical protein
MTLVKMTLVKTTLVEMTLFESWFSERKRQELDSTEILGNPSTAAEDNISRQRRRQLFWQRANEKEDLEISEM